jgi:two-component system cell cycle response regulator DivK
VTFPPPDAPPGESADAERPLVLIVDDNEKNLKLARDVLRAGGFRTLEASTGAAGIALAGKYLPNVILLDLRLPDIDGADVARNLGERARTARIPIIGLSSVPLGESDWFLAAGFAGYLEKPISVGEFADQVRRYCRHHGW